MTIYEDETGYIEGMERPDGVWEVDKFVVHSHLRGRGHGRELARHLPRRCRLHVLPLQARGEPGLDMESLIAFYGRLGFLRDDDELGNVFMERYE